MRFHESPERIIPHDYEIFIGLDVDKSSISVTALDFAGSKKQVHMPYSARRLVRFIGKHYPDQRVALVYEAGPTGYGLYDALREAGHMCLVTAPAMVPQERGRRVKTNRVDSEQLAYRLRGGDLRGIRVPSPVYRKLRYLAHQWNQLSRRTRAVMCQIKALLLMEELTFPGDRWNGAVQARLREMECEPVAQFILRQQVDLLETLQQAQGQLMRQIRAYCRSDEQLAKDLGYVTSIPGIGMVIGMQLLARIGDWRQMKRGRELAALLGLAPWEHSTGTRVVRGGISRTGDRHLRCLLVEAAWTARKRDPELGAFYAHLASRNPQGKGSRKAVVAVARKMTLRIYRVLKDQRNYEIRPPAPAMASESI